MDKMFVNKIINDIEYTLVDIIEYLGKNGESYVAVKREKLEDLVGLDV